MKKIVGFIALVVMAFINQSETAVWRRCRQTANILRFRLFLNL